MRLTAESAEHRLQLTDTAEDGEFLLVQVRVLPHGLRWQGVCVSHLVEAPAERRFTGKCTVSEVSTDDGATVRVVRFDTIEIQRKLQITTKVGD